MDIFLSKVSQDKKEVLLMNIYLMMFFSFPFTICALVVSRTSNAGFNVVLTALLNIGFAGGAYYVVKNSQTPIAVGFLLGSSTMMVLLDLMTAIYWGQLSKCKYYSEYYSHYSCSQPHAYGATCAFAVFLFLTISAFTAAVFYWRTELINESSMYEEVSTNIPGDHPRIDPLASPSSASAEL